MELPDEEREITNLFLRQLAISTIEKGLTPWQTAHNIFNWLNEDVFKAKFEPLRPKYEAYLTEYKKRAVS